MVETQEMLNIFQVVGNLGFPIVITIYLLHRFEKKIEDLEMTITKLTNVINQSIKEN